MAETSLPCPLGKYSVLLGKASVLYDHKGAVIGAIESIRDITESRNTEDALRAEQEKYAKTFIAVPDAVLITEVDTGTILLVNDAAFRLFGYTREELIGDSTVNLGIWSDPEETSRHYRPFTGAGAGAGIYGSMATEVRGSLFR